MPYYFFILQLAALIYFLNQLHVVFLHLMLGQLFLFLFSLEVKLINVVGVSCQLVIWRGY